MLSTHPTYHFCEVRGFYNFVRLFGRVTVDDDDFFVHKIWRECHESNLPTRGMYKSWTCTYLSTVDYAVKIVNLENKKKIINVFNLQLVWTIVSNAMIFRMKFFVSLNLSCIHNSAIFFSFSVFTIKLHQYTWNAIQIVNSNSIWFYEKVIILEYTYYTYILNNFL